MTAKRSKQKTPDANTTHSSVNGKPLPYVDSSQNEALASIQDSLSRRLRLVPGVEAVFIVYEDRIVHVFSVTKDHRSAIYKKLMRQENLVEKDCPEMIFEFHTREHQGRHPHRAVPYGAKMVFQK